MSARRARRELPSPRLDQNSLIIPPGAAYDPPKVSPHAVSIIGATAGQAFFAEEW